MYAGGSLEPLETAILRLMKGTRGVGLGSGVAAAM
jgi:hypothetical protein